MHITKQFLQSEYSQDELDRYVNTMPLSFLKFSSITGLLNRAYRVRTPFDPDFWGASVLETVAMRSLIRNIIIFQQNVIRRYGLSFAPTYHQEVHPYSNRWIQLDYFDVVKTNVKLTTTVVGNANVQFLIEPESYGTSDGYNWFRVPNYYVDNPRLLFFRNLIDSVGSSTFYHMEKQQNVNGYPYQDENYTYVIAPSTIPLDSGSYLQYNQYAYIIIDPVENKTINDIFLFYPNSKQKIFQPKSPEIITINDEEKWLFFVYPWTLKKPTFIDEISSLGHNDWNHFYNSVRYGYEEEEFVASSLDVFLSDCSSDPMSSETVLAKVKIIDSNNSFVLIDSVTVVDSSSDPPTYKQKEIYNRPVSVNIFYKTNGSEYLDENAIEYFTDGVAAKVAANMKYELSNPHDEAELNHLSNYIATMQAPSVSVYPSQFGEPFMHYKAGKLAGDVKFEEVLNNMHHKRKVVLL